MIVNKQLQHFKYCRFSISLLRTDFLRKPKKDYVMNSKNKSLKITTTLEHSLVSNFFRLCTAEGVDSESAHRELEMRLNALSELKPPQA